MAKHCQAQHAAAFGHPVAMCCDMLVVVGSNLKMVKSFHATIVDVAWCYGHLTRFVQQCCTLACVLVRFSIPNISEHVAKGGKTHSTCCAQQYCDMLCWNVAIASPEFANVEPTMLCWAGAVVRVQLARADIILSQPEIVETFDHVKLTLSITSEHKSI